MIAEIALPDFSGLESNEVNEDMQQFGGSNGEKDSDDEDIDDEDSDEEDSKVNDDGQIPFESHGQHGVMQNDFGAHNGLGQEVVNSGVGQQAIGTGQLNWNGSIGTYKGGDGGGLNDIGSGDRRDQGRHTSCRRPTPVSLCLV